MTEIRRGEGAGLSGSRLMLVHADAQDGFTQPARTDVNEHQELSFSQPAAVEFPGDENFLDCLQFGEAVPAAIVPSASSNTVESRFASARQRSATRCRERSFGSRKARRLPTPISGCER